MDEYPHPAGGPGYLPPCVVGALNRRYRDRGAGPESPEEVYHDLNAVLQTPPLIAMENMPHATMAAAQAYFTWYRRYALIRLWQAMQPHPPPPPPPPPSKKRPMPPWINPRDPSTFKHGTSGSGLSVGGSMNKPESSGQMKRWTPRGTPVIDIPTFVSKYGGNLASVLRKTGKAVILYVTQRSPDNESGHWTGLIDHGAAGIEAFDSYGLAPDAEYKFIPPAARAAANEVQKHILPALQASGRKYVWNRTRLQSWDPKIQTCGRHVAVRLAHSNMPLPQYVSWLKNAASVKGSTPDAVVASILP